VTVLELFPKLERFRIAHAREEPRHRPQRLRFVMFELICSDRFFLRIGPFFLVDQGKGAICVSPRLPSFDSVADRTRAEDGSNDHDYEHEHEQENAPSLLLAQADFFRREHVVRGFHQSNKAEKLKSETPKLELRVLP